MIHLELSCIPEVDPSNHDPRSGSTGSLRLIRAPPSSSAVFSFPGDYIEPVPLVAVSVDSR
eukprot:9980786-Heterocapsa_arctica.AAC.1